jgi:hypothetical protein
MISRADKLLEGFKLGSLGVSRKPKVTSEKIEIVKEGINKLKDDSEFEFPFFCWREDDGNYYISVERSSVDTFIVRLYGGKDLALVTSALSRWRGWLVPNEYDWDVSTFSLSNYGSVYSSYEDFVSTIKKGGIDRLLSNYNLDAFNMGLAPTFRLWLKKREKGGTLQQ